MSKKNYETLGYQALTICLLNYKKAQKDNKTFLSRSILTAKENNGKQWGKNTKYTHEIYKSQCIVTKESYFYGAARVIFSIVLRWLKERAD